MTGSFENNKSARIGGVIVFTYEGARNAYKKQAVEQKRKSKGT